MPPVLAGIVRDVALAAEGAIVADAVPAGDLADVVSSLRPDVVILNAAGLDAPPLDALMCGGGRPVRVIALSAKGEEACLHELRPHVAVIGDLSSAALLEAVRGRSGASHG